MQIFETYLWEKDVLDEASDKENTFFVLSGTFGSFREAGVIFQTMVPIRVILEDKLFSSTESPETPVNGLNTDYFATLATKNWEISSSAPYVSIEVKLLSVEIILESVGSKKLLRIKQKSKNK